MRVLALPRYAPLGASSRLRTYQYLPMLQAAGVEVDVRPLLDDQYVRNLYEGRNSAGGVASAYIRRILGLIRGRGYDAIWVEKELLPWLPAFVELGIVPKRIPLVADYDDALFHRYDRHRSAFVRGLLARKIDDVMRRADLVLAGNDYLAGRAREAGAGWVECLPTVVDLARYPVQPPKPATNVSPLMVGWIGSPSTAKYLRAVSEPMRQLAERGLIRCVAIGANPAQLVDTPFSAIPWQEETEVSQLQQLDVGIMPLPDAPWERGKCGYKLIQYMACGLPVVASPVGVNEEIVEVGMNGFLADGEEGWLSALTALAADPQLRVGMGRAGRARVELHYSLEVQASRLRGLLEQVVQRAAR